MRFECKIGVWRYIGTVEETPDGIQVSDFLVFIYIDPRPAFRLPNEERWQLLDGDTPYREIEEVASGVARMLGFSTVWVRGEGSLSEMAV